MPMGWIMCKLCETFGPNDCSGWCDDSHGQVQGGAPGGIGKGITVSKSDYGIYSHGLYCMNLGGGGTVYDCECPGHTDMCQCRSTDRSCDCPAGNSCGAVQ